MQITTLTVSSSRKLPHPNADFSSISSMVTLTATLAEDDHLAGCAKKLQSTADNLVDQHLAAIAERMRSAKPQQATENTAARLAEKHGGRA